MADSLQKLEEFTGLTLASWDDLDIARMNLMSARGLPGVENADIEAMIERLNEWTERVRFEIRRHLYRFDSRTLEPQSEFCFGNSLGRFVCYFLLQVLQEDCGVVYYPDRKFKPDFCQPQDLFIHGILDPEGKGGTCASMPVVYVAVARRLGFPVYLVQTRGHLLFRWDDAKGTLLHWPDLKLWIPPDRFNIEGAGEGIAYPSDSHFIQHPEKWTQIDFAHGRYLRSMTPKEELASFLVQRAECFYELRNLPDALKAIYYARQLCPEDIRYEQLHARRTKEWNDHEETHARIIEMQQDRKRRQMEELPTLPNHGLNCYCRRCKEARAAQGQPVPPHGACCQCMDCNETRQVAAMRLDHPPYCSCFECVQYKTLKERVMRKQSFFPAATQKFQHPALGSNPTQPPNLGNQRPRGLPRQ